MNTIRKIMKWVMLAPLITIGLVVLLFIGWNTAKGIAPEKTCKLYKSMMHSIATPGFVPSDDCRWVKRDPIGHYTVNGIPFTVPREYLWQGSHEPDGSVEALYLMMRYPDMEPAPPDPFHEFNVKITINSTAGLTLCVQDKQCDQISQYLFWRQSGFDLCERMSEGCIYSAGTPAPITEVPEQGLLHYRGAKGVGDLFFKGPPLKPDLWFFCNPILPPEKSRTIPFCETAFQMGDKVFIEYRVRRHAFGDHLAEVHASVVKKLNELINGDISPKTK